MKIKAVVITVTSGLEAPVTNATRFSRENIPVIVSSNFLHKAVVGLASGASGIFQTMTINGPACRNYHFD